MSALFSVAPASVEPGGKAAFTAVITNTGKDELAEDIKIPVTIGSNVKVTLGNTIADKGELTVDSTGLGLTWKGTLSIEENMNLAFEADVAADSGSGELSSQIVAPSGWDMTGTSKASTTVTGASDIITDVVWSNKTPKAGDNITATITLENTGTADYAIDQIIDVTRSPASAFTPGNANVTIGTVSEENFTYTVKATIPVGETQNVTIPVEVLESAVSTNNITASLTKPEGKTSGNLVDVATVPAAVRKAKVKNKLE